MFVHEMYVRCAAHDTFFINEKQKLHLAAFNVFYRVLLDFTAPPSKKWCILCHALARARARCELAEEIFPPRKKFFWSPSVVKKYYNNRNLPKSTKIYRNLPKSTEIYRNQYQNLPKSTKIYQNQYRNLPKSTEIYRNLLKSTEINTEIYRNQFS